MSQQQENSRKKFTCKCGESYTLNPSLYNHIKSKHGADYETYNTSQKINGRPKGSKNKISKELNNQKKETIIYTCLCEEQLQGLGALMNHIRLKHFNKPEFLLPKKKKGRRSNQAMFNEKNTQVSNDEIFQQQFFSSSYELHSQLSQSVEDGFINNQSHYKTGPSQNYQEQNIYQTAISNYSHYKADLSEKYFGQNIYQTAINNQRHYNSGPSENYQEQNIYQTVINNQSYYKSGPSENYFEQNIDSTDEFFNIQPNYDYIQNNNQYN